MPPESEQKPTSDTPPLPDNQPSVSLPAAENTPAAGIPVPGASISPNSSAPNPPSLSPTIPAPTVIAPSAPATVMAEQSSPSTSTPPNPVVPPPVTGPSGASSEPDFFAADPPRKRRLTPKLLPVIAAGVLLIGGGSAAAYFGYYMNPGTVWQQSLSNTGKGYDRLVSYLNTQSQAHYSGFKENGSFKLTDGTDNFDGTLTAQADSTSSTSSTMLDLGVTKLDFETRSIKPAGASAPDIYIQFSGIKDFAADLGPDFGPKVAALDGRWIVIDHNLFADLQQQLTKRQNQSHTAQLTWAEVDSFLQAAGRVNQQYVFTTNKNTSVTTVVKAYGKETVDGHHTYHYKVGFVGPHVKAYITAMCNALQHSGLGPYVQQQTGQPASNSAACKDLEKSATQIKSSDTVDIWADASHRLLYKVRVADKTSPAQNFVDLGLNYQGGNSYPFFVSGQTKDSSGTGTFKLTATLDTKANSLDFVLGASNKGDSTMNLSGNFSVRPSTAKLSVVAPANAESINDVLTSLGLQSYVTELLNAASQSNANPAILSAKTPSGAVVGNAGQPLLSPTSLAAYRDLTSALRLP